MTLRQDDRRAFIRLLLAGCVLPARAVAQQRTPMSPAASNGVTLDPAAKTYQRASGGQHPGCARGGRARSGEQDRARAGRHLPSGGQGAGADLVQRPARRHHARSERRRHPHRRQPRRLRSGRAQPSGDRQPRRLFRGRRQPQDRAARLQDHRGQQLHDRHRRALADRVGRCAEDAVLLRGRRRHQDLRAVVSDDRARRGLRQLHQPLRRRGLGRASRPGPGRGRLPPLHLPQQPHADHRLRRSTCCTAAAPSSRTACSWATSPTSAWTMSGC